MAATITTPTGNTCQNNLNDSSVTALVSGAGPVRVILRHSEPWSGSHPSEPGVPQLLSTAI